MAVANLPGKHVDELDAGMSEMGVGRGAFGQRDQIGLDADGAAERMAEQIVKMPGLGAAPFDAHAGAGLTNEQSRRSSVSANSRVIGTLSALASAPASPATARCCRSRSSKACRPKSRRPRRARRRSGRSTCATGVPRTRCWPRAAGPTLRLAPRSRSGVMSRIGLGAARRTFLAACAAAGRTVGFGSGCHVCLCRFYARDLRQEFAASRKAASRQA